MATTVVLLMLLSVLYADTKPKKEVDVGVVIMGAGMTGISAGQTLHAAGMDNFIILEAQDYIGGRTIQKQFGVGPGARSVNAGGSWISGACYGVGSPNFECRYKGYNPSGVNPMLTRALAGNYRFNRTDIHEWDSIPHFLDGSGVAPPIFVDIEYQQWHDMTDGCLYDIYEAIWDGWREDMSYQAGLDACGWGDQLNVTKTIQWIEFNLEMAAPTTSYSLAMGAGPIETYVEYGNQDLFVTDPRGYNGIIVDLANEYIEMGVNIRLETPVTQIEYTASGVTVHTDDTIYNAQYGLVTFSIGVLQSDIVQYVPPLPSWKQAAISGTMMADYSAVYVQWPNAFWNDEHPEINDNNIVVMMDDRYGYLPWFLNLNHESLMPGSLMWRFDITDEVALKFQNQDIETTTQEIVNDKFSRYFSNVPEPLAVLVGDMSINPYIQGAYSAYPVGYDWYGTVEDLAHTVDISLYFAGEHTNLEESGYVHTSYFEGIRAGSQILDCLGYPSGWYSCQGPYDAMQQKNASKVWREEKIREIKKAKYGPQ